MNKIAILCDFDGTIAVDDVGNRLFRAFTDYDETESVVGQWKKGLISSRECLEREAAMASATREEIDEFICTCRLDPFFKDFVDFTKKRGMEIAIISDGLDYYIEKLLMRHGLGHVDFWSNVLEIEGNTLNVSFPNYDMMDCRDCGNCKTHHLEKFKSAGYFIVYVGNGLSDRCPSTYSDFVFAKGELLDFCRENDLDHMEFRNFRDVEREILKRFVLSEEFMGGEGVGGL